MRHTSCDTIHETVIKDIVDVITDVKNTDNIRGFISGRANSFKSIAAASQNLTLVFPVICTRNMDIANASMIAKAIERKCVTMLQILFSSIAYTNVDNARDYISKFHTNVKLSNNFDVDELLSIADKIGNMDESSQELTKYQEKVIEEALIEDLHRYENAYAPDTISEYAISDYKIMNNTYGDDVIIKEAPVGTPPKGNSYKDWESFGLNAKSEYDKSKAENKGLRDALDKMNNINLRFGSINTGGNNNGGGRYPSQKDIADIYSKQILDGDVKKANELVPTTMVVQFNSLTDTGTICDSSAVIGIKAKLYVADSSDILGHIVSKHSDNNALNKLIRATTREISFWKDLVFAIDKAKFDAISSASNNTSAKMWRVLERRSKKSKVRRTFGTTNDATAITTLVITQNEVEYLKKEENINVEQPNIIKKIMDSYNFMAFVIVDETNEIVKFLFDSGDDHFESYSFSALERESSDNTYKKVINLMTKMR